MEGTRKMVANLAICAILIYVSLIGLANADQCPLYVFGDSLFDTGTALFIDKGPAADGFPYGITHFNRPAGRFSDGRIVPDFIAQFANLPFPEPYWNPDFSSYTEAVNFADAASGVLAETRPKTLNLRLQVSYFLEMAQKMQQQHGLTETRELLGRAVYLFNTGGNDYVDLFTEYPQPLTSLFKNTYINNVLGNLTTHITTIYRQGGRKFAFQNVSPLGCMPSALLPDGSCREGLNAICKTHNKAFAALLDRWTRQFPGLKYSLFDMYNAMSIRLRNGPSFGFKESQSACCGIGRFRGQFTCMQKENFTLCNNPSEHIWFDAGHPTQKANEQLAQEFWSGSPNIVAPYNLKTFFEENQVASI